jgi:hypothetical protein
MKFLLRHPVVTGICIEVLLVVSGVYFSMPDHKRRDIVSTVDAIHYPVNTFIVGMAELLELHPEPVQIEVLTSTFTAPVWIVLLYVVGGFVDPRLGSAPRKASRRMQREAEEEPGNLQRQPPHEPPLVGVGTGNRHSCPSDTGDNAPFPWQRS